MPTTRGHCLCKAIEYEFDGEPLWVAHCHCRSCRRHTSSTVATFVGVKRDRFRYVKGEPAVYESSPTVWRSFCARCGSPMTYTTERYPGEVHLYVGTLADPASVVPRAHVHVGEQLPWFEVADELPRYEKLGGIGEEPLRRGPRPAAPRPEG